MNFKTSEATPTTENQKMKSLEELHTDPAGRGGAGTLDAPWGVAGKEDPMHGGQAAWDVFIQDGPQILARCFDGFEASKQTDRALIGAHFDTKDYTSHSPLLRKYAEAGNVAPESTLQERVMALTGRR